MTPHRIPPSRRSPRTQLAHLALAVTISGLAACDRDQPVAPTAEALSPNVAPEVWTNAVPANLKLTPPDYTTGASVGTGAVAAMIGSPVIRTYKRTNAWFGENRDHATLLALGKVVGTDYFVHPLTDLALGIPAGTTVALMTSNGAGDPVASTEQSAVAAQATLAAFLSAGGVVIVDMGDNDGANGFRAPGAVGTPTLIFPSVQHDATFTAAAAGNDATLGTADDHPIVRGPDGLAGTADDLTNSNIDACCYVAHGNLVDGITLPPSATILATAIFNGVAKPVLAEYCFQGGRVILDTFTKEFIGAQPAGTNGPTNFMRSLFSYALSDAALCNRAPSADPGGPYGGNEGTAISVDGSASSDPDGDALTLSWNFGDPNTVGGGTGSGATPSHVYKENGTYTVTLTVSDGKGGTDFETISVVVANVAPSLGALAVPVAPVALQTGGTTVGVSAALTDPGTLDTHAGSLACDGGTAGAVSASAVNGSGSSSGNCTFSAAGGYTVSMTVADDDGGSDTETAAGYIVVYDPSSGFVTGGGWINSPVGALAADPSSTGKANFGFVAKYLKGATTPSGNTEFVFHAGSLDFHSDSYDWLVIAGARAQYKGEGSIKGRPGTVTFLVTGIDGDVTGGGGIDKFRIKIWDAVTNIVIYDNQSGQLDDSPAATALGGGSISIKSK